MKETDESIDRYLAALESADKTPDIETEARTHHLQEKLAKLKHQIQGLKEIEHRLKQQPDEQVSLTDPDARSMATSGRGTGMVGYNVQAAVETKHHLIVAHEVTNLGYERTQLANMAFQSRDAMGRRIGSDRGQRLLQGPGDTDVRRSRHQDVCAQDHDLEQQSSWKI